MLVRQATTAQKALLSLFLALSEPIKPTNPEEGQLTASCVHQGISAPSWGPCLRSSALTAPTALAVTLPLRSVQLAPTALQARPHPFLALLASTVRVAVSTSSSVKMALTVHLGAPTQQDALEAPLVLETLIMWTEQAAVSLVGEEHIRPQTTISSASIARRATCAWVRPILRHPRVLPFTRATAAQRGTTARCARTRKHLVLWELTQRAWVLLVLPLASAARSAGTMTC